MVHQQFVNNSSIIHPWSIDNSPKKSCRNNVIMRKNYIFMDISKFNDILIEVIIRLITKNYPY